MEAGSRLKGNNSGSTLMLVVICASYIAILCSALLTMTLSNRDMKSVELKAKVNFYSTETALDEIKTGLGNLAADAFESAYIKVMEHYIDSSEGERGTLMSQSFINNLELKLAAAPDNSRYSLEQLRAMITNSSAILTTQPGENLLERDISNPDKPGFLLLKNISVSYTDTERYQTTITTDIIIKTPGIDGLSGGEVTSAFYPYGLIADRGITLQTALDVSVNGNIYAGEDGILLDNLSDLSIGNAEAIITRGDIGVRERSTLRIEGKPMVWVRNLNTLKGSTTSSQTGIYIDGTCYVADDLALEADTSNITLQGEYYGYSYGSYGTPELTNPLVAGNSSAILINGRDSLLDLSGLSTLFLAGRAYVEPELDGNAATDIYMGESIAVKDVQHAYLVPAEFLWCGVNPVPEETYQAYHATPGSLAEVDFGKLVDNPFPIEISDYSDGFFNLFHEFAGGERYVYYYLKFKSEAKANEYMQEYYRIFREDGSDSLLDIDKSMGRSIDGILVNDTYGSIITSGNLLTYQPGGSASLHANTVDRNSDSGSLYAMELMAKQLAARYNCLQRCLEPRQGVPVYDETSLFRSLISTELLISEIDGVITVVVGDYVVYLVNNEVGTPREYVFTIPTDVSLPHQGRQGIIVATGTVRLSGSYTGLIISGKNILLESGATVNASSQIVGSILGAGKPEINSYFRAIRQPSAAGGSLYGISVGDLIEFRNWKRNEE